MKALVTGAGGFIGSHLCEALIEKAYRGKGSFCPYPKQKAIWQQYARRKWDLIHRRN